MKKVLILLILFLTISCIEKFDGIYCTNSYRDVADDEYGEKTNVKQLKVI